MQVECVRPFAATYQNKRYSYSDGDIFEMPKGADWVKAGFCKPVKQSRRKATKKAPEKAVKGDN